MADRIRRLLRGSAGPDSRTVRASEEEPIGATGPAPAYFFLTADGGWAAFTLDGRDFFARCETDHTTGRIVLTEIPDPYICEICGLGYGDGPHEHGGRQNPATITQWAGRRHDFRPRGDFERAADAT